MEWIQSGQVEDKREIGSHTPDSVRRRQVRLLVNRGMFRAGLELDIPASLADRWIAANIAEEIGEKIQCAECDKMMRGYTRK